MLNGEICTTNTVCGGAGWRPAIAKTQGIHKGTLVLALVQTEAELGDSLEGGGERLYFEPRP